MGLNEKAPASRVALQGPKKQTRMEFFKGKAVWFWLSTSAGEAIRLPPTAWRILHLL